MRRVLLSAAALVLVLAVTQCIPMGPTEAELAERQSFEVTVFTDDPITGRRVLAAIEAEGYTNPGNQILDTPNEQFNIKWGGAPEHLVEHVAGIARRMVGHDLVRLKIFGPDDADIFLNLPVCLLGGAARPSTCSPLVVPRSGAGAGLDPRFDAHGIPQACGFTGLDVRWGAIEEGTEVVLGRHRPEDGDANWAEEMTQYVGRTARVTRKHGVDGAGCPVVKVDVDGGEWFWRVRDMQLAGRGRPLVVGRDAIPRDCSMSDETVDYGPIAVGSDVILGRHSPWQGDANWSEEMEPFVGRIARVQDLVGTDVAGCPLVRVDIDNAQWFWRIRDMQLAGATATSGLPEACGMDADTVDYGAARVGALLRLGRHRPVDGDDNWAEEMGQFVGAHASVVRQSGVDMQGCPVVRVDVDNGDWAWRVRDQILVTPAQEGGDFPQACGMSDDTAVYGAAAIGAIVRLGRHRDVDGNPNWAADMEEYVGLVGRVTAHLGVDSVGCPVVHVDADDGDWAWRVRDLSAP
jgi:hypothetical protein